LIQTSFFTGIRDYYSTRIGRRRLDVRTDSPVKGVLEFLAPKHRSMDSRFPGASETGLPSTPALQMNGSSKIDEGDEELEEFYDAFQDMSSSKSPMITA
jgi:hypothetical protein